MNHLEKLFEALVNNNLCRKLFSSLESLERSVEILKVTSGLFSIPHFNLLSCELENVTF